MPRGCLDFDANVDRDERRRVMMTGEWCHLMMLMLTRTMMMLLLLVEVAVMAMVHGEGDVQ